MKGMRLMDARRKTGEKRKVKLTAKAVPDTNWTRGTATLPNGRRFIFDIKHFKEPSSFGIEEGRISKLFIMTEVRRSTVALYDRGWDIRPKSPDVRAVYEALLGRYN